MCVCASLQEFMFIKFDQCPWKLFLKGWIEKIIIKSKYM